MHVPAETMITLDQCGQLIVIVISCIYLSILLPGDTINRTHIYAYLEAYFLQETVKEEEFWTVLSK